jgi:hypothetical protein
MRDIYGQCRSCKAPVMWLKSEATNRTAPIDQESSADGSIAIDTTAGTYRILVGAQRVGTLYTNHFATCPNQEFWRERQRQRAERIGGARLPA